MAGPWLFWEVGLDQIYPPEHKKLAERIVSQGALISDYPLGTPPDGSNFPPRNRIISGLSKVVIVIEAGQKSGALITAGYAAEQGKEVFAVPGKITSPVSKGTNLLIKQGAHPLLSAQDVLDLLNMSLITEQRAVQKTLPGDPREALLFQAVGDEPQHVDEISTLVNLPIEEVTSTLALMELKGMVRKTFGMKYVAVRDMMIDYRSKINLNGKEVNMIENYYAVIMAGGGGTRLWPLSRQSRPKQMLKLGQERSLFQVAVDRLQAIFPPERILVVTVEDQAPGLQEQCPGDSTGEFSIGNHAARNSFSCGLCCGSFE